MNIRNATIARISAATAAAATTVSAITANYAKAKENCTLMLTDDGCIVVVDVAVAGSGW